MKRARKPLLTFALCLATTPAWADSVAQFAPLDEAASPAPSPPSKPAAAPSAGAPSPTNAPAPRPAASTPNAAPAWTPPSAPATPTWTPPPPTPSAAYPLPSSATTPSSAPVSVNSPEATSGSSEAASSANSVNSAAQSPSASDAPDLPSDADAVHDSGGDEAESDNLHRVSLSFSVARAVASLYEVTAEVGLGQRFGIALLGGLGSLEAKHPDYSQTMDLHGKELGAQARVYLIGGFDHGLMLGGEALRIWAEASPTAVTDPALVTINGVRASDNAVLSGEGTLTGLGAFIGYKVIASFGLTFDAKLGYQRLTLDATGRVSGDASIAGQLIPVSESRDIHESRGVPLFNLNLGWSI